MDGVLALRYVFDAMPEPVWVARPDSAIVYANPAALELTGLPMETLSESGWMSIQHPDDAEDVFRRVSHTIATGEPFEIECRLRNQDGEYRWIRSRARALRDEAGTIVAFLGSLTDIDPYRRRELAAVHAEIRLRRLLDSNIVAVVVADLDGRLVEANAAFFGSFGYTQNDLENGLRWDRITPPEWLDADAQAVRALRETGVAAPYFKEYFSRDGRRIPIVVAPAMLPDEDRAIAFVLDLSRQHEYAVALEESEATYKALADSAPILVWTANPSGNLDFFNRAISRYTGLPPDELFGAGYRATVHPDDEPERQRRWSAALATGEPYRSEIRIRRHDGTYRWHESQAQPVRNDRGEIVKWVGTSVDVDERKRISERQRFLLDALDALGAPLDPIAIYERLAGACVPYMAASSAVFKRHGSLWAFVAGDRSLNVRIPDEVTYERGVVAVGDKHLVPIVSGTGIDAVLVLETKARALDTSDVETLAVVAAKAGVALENAEKYQREHRVAEALQNASLPGSLPSNVPCRFDGFYAAAQSEAQIGGDWYDAFALADGRVVVSIGDVTGHGLAAAVIMANMRQVIRGIAQVHPDPALMLDAADKALRAEHPGVNVTAFVAVLDFVTESLAYGTAGHPPAVVRTREGGVSLLHQVALPLGLRTREEPLTEYCGFAPGDRFVFYTDGLTESQRDSLAGEAALVELVRLGGVFAQPSPARAIADALAGDRHADDIAILTLEIEESAAVVPVRRWMLHTGQTAAIRQARKALLDYICEHCSQQLDPFAGEIVASELIGNVVRHAPGPFEVLLQRSDDRIVLHVLDRGRGFVFIRSLPDPDTEHGRGLFLVRALTDDFDVTPRAGGGSHARAVFSRRHRLG